MTRVYADLHIHGPYSYGTSKQMNLVEIARYAKIKGLNLVGTGDFTHPMWLKEIQETLTSDHDSGLLKLSKGNSPIRFILQTEVSTIYDYQAQSKKVHHIILSPNLEVVAQVNDCLNQFGNLASDGRPILKATAPQLVDEVMGISSDNMVFPAHAWTPWFGIFGAFSGFDTIEDCYQDMTKHIHALETGLSSDPPMNWRVSKVDRYTLVSNSDCHSFWPWRIGREANILDLPDLTYNHTVSAISDNDPQRFKFTIEADPAYGKYHWTGHRNCKISLSPKEAIKVNNICPVCQKPLTKGVEQRVEELADRDTTYKRPSAPGFKHLIPLSEILCAVIGASSPAASSVWRVYNSLIEKFGNEYTVLLDASVEALNSLVDVSIAQAIVKVRNGVAKVTPGYDGVYGQLVVDSYKPEIYPQSAEPKLKQRSISDFFGK